MSISNIFKPKFKYQLQRVGKNNDGGYLVGINTIKQSKVLISYGINDDWSFEKNFYKINNKIKIMTFDDKLNLFFLLKKLLNNFFKIFLPRYKSFFLRSMLNIFELKEMYNYYMDNFNIPMTFVNTVRGPLKFIIRNLKQKDKDILLKNYEDMKDYSYIKSEILLEPYDIDNKKMIKYCDDLSKHRKFNWRDLWHEY